MQIDWLKQVNTSLTAGFRATALRERYPVTRAAFVQREARQIYSSASSAATSSHCSNSCAFSDAAPSYEPFLVHAGSVRWTRTAGAAKQQQGIYHCFTSWSMAYESSPSNFETVSPFKDVLHLERIVCEQEKGPFADYGSSSAHRIKFLVAG